MAKEYEFLRVNIIKIRKNLKLTQEQFAEKQEVSTAMQKSYELGKSKPDILYLERLSYMCRVSMQELMSRELKLNEIITRAYFEKIQPADDSPNYWKEQAFALMRLLAIYIKKDEEIKKQIY